MLGATSVANEVISAKIARMIPPLRTMLLRKDRLLHVNLGVSHINVLLRARS
jgi:hypothetical protein